MKKNKPVTSPLFWSDKYPAIALAEILCGMSLLESIQTDDGAPAPFTLIIKTFESFFNVKLGNPQEVERNILRRKINLTKFTDSIRHALKNYVEK